MALILPLSSCAVILLRPFLLLPSLNTLIAPGLHTLSLLLEHRPTPPDAVQGDVAAHTALLPSAVAVYMVELSLQAAVILVWHLEKPVREVLACCLVR